MIKRPKGTLDILPEDIKKWKHVESKFSLVANRFGFKEIRTPVFEYTELFARGVGDTTDVVQKEMYTFADKGDRSVTLRPEGTAGAVRAYLENGIYAKSPISKLFYNITCYRHEKPQAGRLREFHQLGVEMYGPTNAMSDVEVIALANTFFTEIGVKNISININSIGCPTCRSAYNEKLREYLKANEETLCETCRERLIKNPLRVLDCKSPVCQDVAKDAPRLIDFICDECESHFDEVKRGLTSLGINYNIDPSIVRGLDYYTKTVFEIKSGSLGAQNTICGGGRYDGLIETLGGNATAGIGFALGVERLLMVMENDGAFLPEEDKAEVFIGYMGEKGKAEALKVAIDLRTKGILTEVELLDRSVKAQMKYADKIGAKYSLVLGDDEIDKNMVTVKNMETGEREECEISKIADVVRR